MRDLLPLLALLSLVTLGCNGQKDSSPSPRQSSTSATPAHGPSSKAPSIPPDVSYSIINSEKVQGVKRSLEVQLNKKVSEETLRAIALELKSQNSGGYDRIFITYYLPGMRVGAGAWATTHFNPDQEVRILGLTAEEETKLATEPTPANREIIGRWLDESPYVGSRITIFREGGKLYIEQKFKDGSSHKIELFEKRSPLGRRFDKLEGSRFGDHWVLDSHGNLQMRDNDGLIATAKKIE